ncbi:hypothetical protein [Helicobacter japonicus]|uniref:hypothetical protein n=1 Tax=Helicobacter japonicus TaxID=425400 RepID=UPI00262A5F98|nr:hypothetical protein [Helicobacter japonicus]
MGNINDCKPPPAFLHYALILVVGLTYTLFISTTLAVAKDLFDKTLLDKENSSLATTV